MSFFGFFARRPPANEPVPTVETAAPAAKAVAEPTRPAEASISADETLEGTIGAALDGRLGDDGPRYEIRELDDGWCVVDRVTNDVAAVHGYYLEHLHPKRAKSLAEVLNRTAHRRGVARRAA